MHGPHYWLWYGLIFGLINLVIGLFFKRTGIPFKRNVSLWLAFGFVVFGVVKQLAK